MGEDQQGIKPALPAEPTSEKIPQNEQLQLTAQELKGKPTDPDAVTLFWRTFMDDITKRIGIDPIEVPPVDKTTEELEQLQKKGRIMVYNPAFSYAQLERAFPDIQIVNGDEYEPDKDLIEDMVNIGRNLGEKAERAEGSDLEYLVDKQTGWFDVGIEPLESDPVVLKFSSSTERWFWENSQSPKHSARLSTYILGSKANRLVTGHFLSFDGAKMFGTHYKWRDYPTAVADFKPDGKVSIKRSATDKFYDDLPEWAG